MNDHDHPPNLDPVDPLLKDFDETGKHTGDDGSLAEETDLDQTFRGLTYLYRLRLVESDGMSAPALNTIDDLKKKYGTENIIVSAVSIDPDTQEKITGSDGSVGVWVKSDAKLAVDNA